MFMSNFKTTAIIVKYNYGTPADGGTPAHGVPSVDGGAPVDGGALAFTGTAYATVGTGCISCGEMQGAEEEHQNII